MTPTTTTPRCCLSCGDAERPNAPLINLRCKQCHGEITRRGQEATAEEDEAYRIEPRQPWEKPHFCLWCGKWNQALPLRRCEACQLEYQRAMVGMPKAGPKEMGE